MEIAHSFQEAAKAYQQNPTALHLRAMNMLYEGLKEKGALMLVPSSAVESMGMGGLLGAVYVSVALVAVRTLGASGLTAAVIAGQLAMSLVIDRLGLLGVARQSIGAQRIVGLVLLLAGVVLVVRH